MRIAVIKREIAFYIRGVIIFLYLPSPIKENAYPNAEKAFSESFHQVARYFIQVRNKRQLFIIT